MVTNKLVLDAILATREKLRYTPAGVPAIDFYLSHSSVQREAGLDRKVDCELNAVAVGAVALRLADLAIGLSLRCSGFIARRYRTGITVAMHVTEFELID